MVKVEDKLGELVGKFVRIETKDGTEFSLKPREEHKRKLLFDYKKGTENDLIFTNHIKKNTLTTALKEERDKFRETSYEVQNTIITQIVKESYPTLDEKQLDGVMQKYGTELLEEIYCFYGWIDKEVREAQRKAILVEIKKLDGEEKNPGKKLENNKPSEQEQNSEQDK